MITRDNWEDLGLDVRILLKWMLKKQYVCVWTEFHLLKMLSSGICREPSYSIKAGNFLPSWATANF
jgi:hypothetical protein